MKTITTDRIERLARAGNAPDLTTARTAAAEGRLWGVDTGNAGFDSVLDSDGAEEALAEVAAFAGLDSVPPHWTAERLALE